MLRPITLFLALLVCSPGGWSDDIPVVRSWDHLRALDFPIAADWDWRNGTLAQPVVARH